MTNGLKVYYIPRLPFYAQSTFPTIYGTLPIVRAILIRERITVIHGHQVWSKQKMVSILKLPRDGVNSDVTKRWCQFVRVFVGWHPDSKTLHAGLVVCTIFQV
jgi:hypothetical protein